MAYESYFDANGSGCGCSIFDLTMNPLAAAAYGTAYAG